ncbi:MAG: hypothetical protein QOE62_855 [Actinomycetota bacterium]|nr:hypothetical protein [Actinomycetota bacterium]
MRRLAVGIVAATLSIAGCSGSSKTSGAPAGGATTTTAKSTDDATNTTVSGGGRDDVSKLAAQYAKARIKISYTSSSSGESTALTIAQDGNGKSAFTTGDATNYIDRKSSVSCQGSGATAKCIDLGSTGGGAPNIGATYTATFALLAGALSTLPGGEKSSEKIAGRNASCVRYKASDVIGKVASSPLFKGNAKASDYDANDTATICIDKATGFVLKFGDTKKGAAQDVLVATAVSEPNDADFTAPATPRTLPSIPNVSIPGP